MVREYLMEGALVIVSYVTAMGFLLGANYIYTKTAALDTKIEALDKKLSGKIEDLNIRMVKAEDRIELRNKVVYILPEKHDEPKEN